MSRVSLFREECLRTSDGVMFARSSWRAQIRDEVLRYSWEVELDL